MHRYAEGGFITCVGIRLPGKENYGALRGRLIYDADMAAAAGRIQDKFQASPNPKPLIPNNFFTGMSSVSEVGSYSRRIDFCIAQL